MLLEALWFVCCFLFGLLALVITDFVLDEVLFEGCDFDDRTMAEDAGLKPLTALDGVAEVVPPAYHSVLGRAHVALRRRLNVIGFVAGVLSVVLGALLMAALVPISIVPWLSLLLIPASAWIRLGPGGIRKDVERHGHVRAAFLQLFHGAYCIGSFVAAVVALLIRFTPLGARWFPVAG